MLAKLADAHPVVALLLQYRELERAALRLYVDGYLPLIGRDGRIHTRFNQTAATTGRLSSDRPNLQNIPVRSETGRTMGPSPSSLAWGGVSWWRITPRSNCGCWRTCRAIRGWSRRSKQRPTSIAPPPPDVFGLAPEHVTSEMRRHAKVINFGLLYGMEAFGLADRLEISREEAREHIDA